MFEEQSSEEPPASQTDIEDAFKFLSQSLAKAMLAKEQAETKAEKYRHDATHDNLTGLLNRKGLDEALKEFQAGGKRPLVIMADVANLKALNDRHPDKHKAGDKLLVGVASLLRSSVRNDTIVARTGGDEFVIVMDADESRDSYRDGHRQKQISPDDMADRIRRRIDVSMNLYLLANSNDLGDANVHISTGYGIDDDFQTALHQADKAMYEHKQSQHSQMGNYR